MNSDMTLRHQGATKARTQSALASRQLVVISSPKQTVTADLAGDVASDPNIVGSVGTIAVSVRTFSGIVQTFRYLAGASEDYVILSSRHSVLWDLPLVDRVKQEILELESLGIPWLCLAADGADINGQTYVAAHFDYEPSLTPDRGRRLIAQTAGIAVVINMASYRSLGLKGGFRGDLARLINDLIILGYARGYGSLFTSRIFPCLVEHRGLDYAIVDDRLVSFVPQSYLSASDVGQLFPYGVERRDLLAAWIEIVELACKTKYRISFVIRTLFRRKHLIHRCLISIDYLRISLGFDAEIILATDIDQAAATREAGELINHFPSLEFTVTDGRSERGHSRVRNLIAGLRATTGTRVCIIDDDDFYTPQAIASFEQACAFGRDEMVIFDTQIVLERWLHGGIKPHRELLSYQTRFPAKDWAIAFKGTNSVPLCGIIHPGWFIRQVTHEYRFDFDLSEDFIFHLYCFSHPRRPPVLTMDGVGAYQSHREQDDNVSNVEDRTRWTADTGNGLYQMLFEQGRNFEVVSNADTMRVGEQTSFSRANLEIELKLARERGDEAMRALASLLNRFDVAETNICSREEAASVALESERVSREQASLAALESERERVEQATRALASLLDQVGVAEADIGSGEEEADAAIATLAGLVDKLESQALVTTGGKTSRRTRVSRAASIFRARSRRSTGHM